MEDGKSFFLLDGESRVGLWGNLAEDGEYFFPLDGESRVLVVLNLGAMTFWKW